LSDDYATHCSLLFARRFFSGKRLENLIWPQKPRVSQGVEAALKISSSLGNARHAGSLLCEKCESTVYTLMRNQMHHTSFT
jgi:hypothetical protein